MNEYADFVIFADESALEPVEQLLEGTGAGRVKAVTSRMFKVRVPAGSPVIERVRTQLEQSSHDWIERIHRIYTEQELRVAPLLTLITTREPPLHGGPKHGTLYDLTKACAACGTGAAQVSPLYLKRAEVPTRGAIFKTLDGEVIVSEELGAAIRDAGFTGLELQPTRAAGSDETLPWLQLVATHELPPMDLERSGGLTRENACVVCGRDGFFMDSDVPLEIVYTGLETKGLPDFSQTYERFGNSRLELLLEHSHFAPPVILIKPGVYEFLREQRVRGLEFDPVVVHSTGE